MAGKKTETSKATEETKAVAMANGGAVATTDVPDLMDLGAHDGAGFEGADAGSMPFPSSRSCKRCRRRSMKTTRSTSRVRSPAYS
ncbi:hypothetical protein WP1_001 [Pseudomonas phage WP1]